jgi:hypothetical protein
VTIDPRTRRSATQRSAVTGCTKPSNGKSPVCRNSRRGSPLRRYTPRSFGQSFDTRTDPPGHHSCFGRRYSWRLGTTRHHYSDRCRIRDSIPHLGRLVRTARNWRDRLPDRRRHHCSIASLPRRMARNCHHTHHRHTTCPDTASDSRWVAVVMVETSAVELAGIRGFSSFCAFSCAWPHSRSTGGAQLLHRLAQARHRGAIWRS